jgi:hypothetical protein
VIIYNGYQVYNEISAFMNGRKVPNAGWSGAWSIISGSAQAAVAGCAAGSFGEGLLQAGLEVPANTGALYAGGEGAAEAAASESGLNIISDTPVGDVADRVLGDLPRGLTQPVWNYLSSLYAEGLTGEVTVFQGEMNAVEYGNSILINTELPIVQGNFGITVTNIIMGAVP